VVLELLDFGLKMVELVHLQRCLTKCERLVGRRKAPVAPESSQHPQTGEERDTPRVPATPLEDGKGVECLDRLCLQ